MRVFIDKNLVEVFANDRQAAVAAGKYVPENLAVRLFSNGGDILVKQITCWKMKSIYTDGIKAAIPVASGQDVTPTTSMAKPAGSRDNTLSIMANTSRAGRGSITDFAIKKQE